MKGNSINWFEVPAKDIDRAKTFYETIFQIKMEIHDMGGAKMALFPYEHDSGKVTGAIAQSKEHIPSQDGVVVYFNGGDNLQVMLDRVEGANGKVLMPKTLIAKDIGYMAFFIDSEGNKVALHSPT